MAGPSLELPWAGLKGGEGGSALSKRMVGWSQRPGVWPNPQSSRESVTSLLYPLNVFQGKQQKPSYGHVGARK